MQHRLPVDALGPDGPAMAVAVSSCVHCGFCLPACPTYAVLGEEMDSPRGRIVLMKEALEGTLPLADAAVHLDRCLGCLACETACPSGVRYRDLIEPVRERLAAARPAWRRAATTRLLNVMESRDRFRRALRLGRLARPVSAVLPETLRAMLSLLPATRPSADSPAATTPAEGLRRGRVALLRGCVQDVLRPSITAAAIRVLTREGFDVVVPADQGCCGALAAHCGQRARGEHLVDACRKAIPAGVDALVITAAGCGSWLKDTASGAAGPPAIDIAEFLASAGLTGAYELPAPARVAYQDACHLLHAQGSSAAPRRLLDHVRHLTLVPIRDAGMCCGSAGLYNLEQPEIAAALGARKAAALAASGAAIVASGNIGCLTQLEKALAEAGAAIRLRHTIELLAEASVPSRQTVEDR
jgi:glycolate oxidase iron-sulfur subunit